MSRRLRAPRPTVARKIVLLSLTVGALFGVVAAFGLAQNSRLEKQLDEQYRTDVVALGDVTELSQALAEQHSAVLSHILSDPGFYQSKYSEHIVDTDNRVNQELSELKQLELTPSQRNQVQSLEALLPAWRSYRDAALQASAEGDRPRAAALVLVRSQAISEALQNRVDDVVTDLDHAVAQGTRDAQASSQRTTQLMLVCLVVATVTAVSFSILVARSIARPLRQAVSVLKGVGSGDLSRRLTPGTRDEVGEMARSLNKTLDVLEESFATMQHWATHDSLTGLANRHSFHLAAKDLLERATSGHQALLLIDLNGFKNVNDLFGHAVGDELLVEIGRRMRENVRPQDLAARLGGDEFAVLLDGLTGPDEAYEVAARLQEAIQAPMVVNDIGLLPGASIGVAHWNHQAGIDEFLHEADTAMYAAKATSRTHVSIGSLSSAAHRRPADHRTDDDGTA